MIRWVQDCFLRTLSARNHFSIMSIGSGNGDFDFRFIRTLQPKIQSLEYTALEPNEALLNQFKARMVGAPISDVQFDIHSVPLEEFASDKRYDLVHLTHCLYYIPDREQAILKAVNLILENGRVLIFHHTPMGINQFQRKFLKRLKGNENEMFSSREIKEILVHHQIPFQLDVVDSFIDISDCLTFESEMGVQLLSFFLECDIRQVSPAIKQEVIDYIQGFSSLIRGRWLVYQPVAVFSLIKTPIQSCQ